MTEWRLVIRTGYCLQISWLFSLYGDAKNIDKDHRERELPDLYMKKKKGFPEIKDTTGRRTYRSYLRGYQ